MDWVAEGRKRAGYPFIALIYLKSCSRAGYLLIGSLFYVVDTVLMTIVFKVPRNDALAAVNAASSGGPRLWADFVRAWTAWNRVRTIAALVAAALLTVGLCLSRVS